MVNASAWHPISCANVDATNKTLTQRIINDGVVVYTADPVTIKDDFFVDGVFNVIYPHIVPLAVNVFLVVNFLLFAIYKSPP